MTNFIELRGRNDWSVHGLLSTYQGSQWTREIIVFDQNGENYVQITEGGHNLAPSFSPDGEWMTYTSYRDNFKNVNGCEIYIMRIDGSDIRRVTENYFCDWQPRWSD